MKHQATRILVATGLALAATGCDNALKKAVGAYVEAVQGSSEATVVLISRCANEEKAELRKPLCDQAIRSVQTVGSSAATLSSAVK